MGLTVNVPASAQKSFAAMARFPESWHPLDLSPSREGINVAAKRMIDALEAVTDLPVEITFQKLPPQAAAAAERREPSRTLLDDLRGAMAAIEWADRLFVPNLARWFRKLAANYFAASNRATNSLSHLRALLSLTLAEPDYKSLGFKFVPAPSVGDAGPPVDVWAELEEPRPEGPNVVVCTGAALSQLAQIKARGDGQQPNNAYRLFWEATKAIVVDLATRDLAQCSQPVNDPLPVYRATLGPVQYLMLHSQEKRTVALLLVTSWEREDPWEAIKEIRERFQGSEWDQTFEALGSYARLTPRGLEALRTVLADRTESPLKTRAASLQPHDPLYVEDVRPAFDEAVEAARDIMDEDDAEAAQQEAFTPWADFHRELDS